MAEKETKTVSVRLSLSKDQDIINFIKNSNYSATTLIKLGLRELIKQGQVTLDFSGSKQEIEPNVQKKAENTKKTNTSKQTKKLLINGFKGISSNDVEKR
ncbi:hypothetical protein FC89_GL000211 [Liquorilactobacillus ghanensis DSM 18630]|uniref:Uncharacterized protein n=1 Tax=Liquorilactobacillus ghanensis DSM 18630 TaxID=1423750 RepID=A0A0R1VXI1_9LACO|nr:hypothetical protein [Liquorilactobacillus ghanensis]KRM07526.1 hypothetical protein FC89_GL000211 [Liquorilactobacillus ghanensis DSM 18630]